MDTECAQSSTTGLASHKTADFLLSTYRLISFPTVRIQILLHLNRVVSYLELNKYQVHAASKEPPLLSIPNFNKWFRSKFGKFDMMFAESRVI